MLQPQKLSPPVLNVRDSVLEAFTVSDPFAVLPVTTENSSGSSISLGYFNEYLGPNWPLALSGPLKSLGSVPSTKSTKNESSSSSLPQHPLNSYFGGYTEEEMDNWGLTFGRGKYFNSVEQLADGLAFARSVMQPTVSTVATTKDSPVKSRPSKVNLKHYDNIGSFVKSMGAPVKKKAVAAAAAAAARATSAASVALTANATSVGTSPPKKLRHKPSTLQRLLQKLV